MTSLDIRTLSFLATASSLFLALGLLLVNRVLSKESSLRLWTLGACASGAAFVLFALRGVVPDLISIVLANTLLIAGTVWFYLGNREFQGLKGGLPWYWLVVAIAAVLFFYFTYLTPNLSARIVLFSVATASVLFPSAHVLAGAGNRRDRLVRWFVAGALLTAGVFLMARAIATLFLASPGQDYMQVASPFHTYSLVVGICLNTALGVGFPLLVSGKMQWRLMEDVAARLGAEAALAQSELQFRGAFESAAHGMAIVSTAGNFTRVNAALCAMLGYSAAEMLATDFQTITHPDDLAADEAYVQELLDGVRAAYQMEKRYVHKSGRIIWVQLSVSLVRAKDGTPVHFVAQIQDITHSKSAVGRLQTLLDTASDGIHVLDEKGDLVQFSPSFARMLGYTVHEAAELNVRDWDAQIPADELISRIHSPMREPKAFETRHRRKDGSVIDVEINAKGIDFDGRACLYASSRDITERKLDQRRLEQLLAEQKAMLEHELIGIVKVRNRTILWANPSFERMLGYGPGELNGTSTRPRFPNEAAYRAFGVAAYAALAKGEVFRAQIEQVRKDGEIIWVDVSGSILDKETGESLWGFIDVTDSRMHDRAIRQSEQRMELALEGADLGLWDLDMVSGRVMHNPRLFSMLGYQADELALNAPTVMSLIHPDDLSRYQSDFRATLKGGIPQLDVECRMEHKNSSWVWVRFRGKVVERDAHGRAVRMAGTTTNISVRKANEAKIHELAFFDPLTKLPNRRLLLDRLSLALPSSGRHDSFGAILFLDLDNFKSLNDTKGHELGDLLLIEVARRLLSCVRNEDTVSRLGGDEFVVMLEDLNQEAEMATREAESVGAKILDSVGAVYSLGDFSHHCTCSIGIALFKGKDVSPGEIIKRADLAMYQAKAANRNTIRLFESVQPGENLPVRPR
jgi:diguanylate cyclase (GGDEF)-like protein/PAS domain S-box-containing protein